MIEKYKEFIIAICVFLVLSAALFIFKTNDNIINKIVDCLVMGFTAILTFYFTKHSPGNKG